MKYNETSKNLKITESIKLFSSWGAQRLAEFIGVRKEVLKQRESRRCPLTDFIMFHPRGFPWEVGEFATDSKSDVRSP